MTTTRIELPYPCIVPRQRLGASLLRGGSSVMIVMLCYRYANFQLGSW